MTKELSLEEAFAHLDEVAPNIPILALGQTVFWDEPMKAGIANWLASHGNGRDFVAGIHDTDYFAKVPGSTKGQEGFLALPHNDTSTKEIWSAAAEFSTLFGSETVIKRDTFTASGLRTRRLEALHPGFVEKLTEAWGWRGIVSVGDDSLVASEVPCRSILPELKRALDWAIDESLNCLEGESYEAGLKRANELRDLVCDRADESSCCTLSDLYESFLAQLHRLVSGKESRISTTRTSRLLRFNRESCELPRFELLDIFIRPETRAIAVQAYNTAVRGSGLYELDRFGTGALPFDVYIPKIGRGTIRLGKRGAVLMTPQPQFLTFAKEPKTVKDFAIALEEKFGSHCVVVGKAVTLIGMLSREYCFAFHEGASGYVHRSRQLQQILSSQLSIDFKLHPILRVKYDAWSSLAAVNANIKVPLPLQGPFNRQSITTKEFAANWQKVGADQEKLLSELGTLKRPLDLLQFLTKHTAEAEKGIYEPSEFWKEQASKYEEVQAEQSKVQALIDEKRQVRQGLYQKIRFLKLERQNLEQAMGAHFREFIFEKEPTEADLQKRQSFQDAIAKTVADIDLAKADLKVASQDQGRITQGSDRKARHQVRRQIECLAEEARARLIREAVIASAGLQHSNLRPSAWWFPLVSPDGQWFAKTVESAQCYLEPLN